jgi:Tfp pilus assembly protein PilE
MIVVAIIAILAAIAIPAYNNYIREARMAKVTDHFDNAVRTTRAELAKRSAAMARGDNTMTALNNTSLVRIINPDGRLSPQGGKPAYDTTADPTNGVILIGVTGATAGAEVVNISRPQYLDIGAATATINATQI